MSHPQVRPLRFPNKFRTTGAKNVFPPFESLIHSEGLTSIENYEKSQRQKRYAERSNAGFKGKQVYEQDPRLGKNDDEGLDWLLPTMSGLSSLGGLTGDVLTKIGAQNANLTSEQQKAYVRLARIWDMKQDYDKAQNVLRALAAASEQQGGYPDWWDVLPLVWQQYLIQTQQAIRSGKMKVAPIEAKDKPTKEQVIQQQRQNLEARREGYEQLQNQVNPLNPIPKDKVKESMPDGAEPLAITSGNVKNSNVLGAPAVQQQQYNDPDNASRVIATGQNAVSGATSKSTSIGEKPISPASFSVEPVKTVNQGDLSAAKNGNLVVELGPGDIQLMDAHHRPMHVPSYLSKSQLEASRIRQSKANERDAQIRKAYSEQVFDLPSPPLPDYDAPSPPIRESPEIPQTPSLIASHIMIEPVSTVAKSTSKEQVGDISAAAQGVSHDPPKEGVEVAPGVTVTDLEPGVITEPYNPELIREPKSRSRTYHRDAFLKMRKFPVFLIGINSILEPYGAKVTAEEYANLLANALMNPVTKKISHEEAMKLVNSYIKDYLDFEFGGDDNPENYRLPLQEEINNFMGSKGFGEFRKRKRRKLN